MFPVETSWILTAPDNAAYCPSCYQDDINHGRTPYLRLSWLDAWRTYCPTHRTMLYSERDLLGQRTFSAERVVHSVAQQKEKRGLYTPRGDAVSVFDKLSEASRCRNPIVGHLLALEDNIANASRGRSPNTKVFGRLRARHFLRLVDDVCTFVLTNFDATAARPQCERTVAWESGAPYTFAHAPQRQPGNGLPITLRRLSSVTPPALRRTALWACLRLIAPCDAGAEYPATRPKERQRKVLRDCARLGLAWLRMSMEKWPHEYRRNHWIRPEHIWIPGDLMTQ